MSDNEKSIQLDDIMRILEVLERRITRLETSLDVHRKACDTMSDNVYSMYKRISNIDSKIYPLCDTIDTMESDITFLFRLMHGGDNFCGNCKRCLPCSDGMYRCDITKSEIDPDSSSCIRFDSLRTPKSDAEICKACPDRDTPRCHKCYHFPF